MSNENVTSSDVVSYRLKPTPDAESNCSCARLGLLVHYHCYLTKTRSGCMLYTPWTRETSTADDSYGADTTDLVTAILYCWAK